MTLLIYVKEPVNLPHVHNTCAKYQKLRRLDESRDLPNARAKGNVNQFTQFIYRGENKYLFKSKV